MFIVQWFLTSNFVGVWKQNNVDSLLYIFRSPWVFGSVHQVHYGFVPLAGHSIFETSYYQQCQAIMSIRFLMLMEWME